MTTPAPPARDPTTHGPGRNVLRNFTRLATGRVAGALANVVTSVLIARTLGAGAFGTLILIHTGALFLRQLCQVKTSDALVQFGVPLQEQGRIDQLNALRSWLFRIDLLSCTGATVVGFCLLAFAPSDAVEPSARNAAWMYLPALIISCTQTTKGTLRLLNRYDLLGKQYAIGPLFRLCGTFIALTVDAPLGIYVTVWALSVLGEQAYLHAAVRGPLAAIASDSPSATTAALRADHPGLFRLLHTLYWQSNVDALPRHATTLVVGAVGGAANAGLFRIARDVAEILGRPVAMLRQALFPDVARLARQDALAFESLLLRTMGITLIAGAVFVSVAALWGSSLLSTLVGAEFVPAHGLLILLLVAATLDLAAAPLRPALYVLGRARTALWIGIAVYTVLLGVLGLVRPPLSLTGTGLAIALASAALLVALGGVYTLARDALRN